MLYSPTLPCTVLGRDAVLCCTCYCIPLHYIYYIVSILHYPALRCTALPQAVYRTVLHHAALRYPVLYCIVL